MADLSELNSSGSVKVAGSNPATGAESYYLDINSSGEASVNDTANSSCVYGANTITTTASIVKVGGSNLANRKEIMVLNNSLVTLYFGFDSSVTTTSGTPLAPNQSMSLRIGPSINLYMIAGLGSNNVRVTEYA